MSIIKIILWPVVFLFKLALRLLSIILIIYLVLHYVNVYDYVSKDSIPSPVRVAIEYSQSTSFSEAIKDAWAQNPLIGISLPSLPSINLFSSDNVLTINTNPNSKIGAVLDFNNGGGVVAYTSNHGGRKKITKMVGRSKKGNTASLEIDPTTMLPTKMEMDGYTILYHRFTNIGVDVSIIDQDGKMGEVETALFDKAFAKENSLIKTANASVITKGILWVAKTGAKFMGKTAAAVGVNTLDFDETMDFNMWSEHISNIENIAVCGIGLATIWVPTGVSQAAAAWGCGNYLAQTVPQYVEIDEVDICKTKDPYTGSCISSAINYASGAKSGAPATKLYLQGQVVISSKYRSLLQSNPVKITFIHSDGSRVVVKNVTNLFGFDLNNPGALLKLGRHNVVVESKGFKTSKFTLVFDTQHRLLIRDDEKTVYDKVASWKNGGHFWKFKLFANDQTEDFISAEEPDSVKEDFDGRWQGKGVATNIIAGTDYREECEKGMPIFIDVNAGRVKGGTTVKMKYDVVDVTGRVSKEGHLSGKVKALKFITLGTFDITFKGKTASGKWNSDRFKCSGTVTLRKK